MKFTIKNQNFARRNKIVLPEMAHSDSKDISAVAMWRNGITY